MIDNNKICLFGTLVRFCRVVLEKGSHDNLSKKLGVSVEEIEEYENNTLLPTNDVLEKMSKEFNVEKSKIEYFIYHDAEPKKLSLKFRKKAFVLQSQLMVFFLNMYEYKF